MFTESEGIVLKQTKTLENKRMLVLLSPKYGKISAGTSISEKGKKKSTLVLRPFCKGRYELYKNKDLYNITSGEVLESFYSIGEDVEKYMAASFILELTEAMIEENEPQPEIYGLLSEYLQLMSLRKNAFSTLNIAYQLKAFKCLGSGIEVKLCRRCEKEAKEENLFLSVSEGGIICNSCIKKEDLKSPLIFSMPSDIISSIAYILEHPLKALEKLALPSASEERLKLFLASYRSFHLGIDHLKSDAVLKF